MPLTTNIADAEELLALAQAAGVRHVVGGQRRLVGPSARYVHDRLAEGDVGQIRSVRVHVSMDYFQRRRSTDLARTMPAENFSHILSLEILNQRGIWHFPFPSQLDLVGVNDGCDQTRKAGFDLRTAGSVVHLDATPFAPDQAGLPERLEVLGKGGFRNAFLADL